MGKILIVEDEKNLGATLMEFLNANGHISYWASTPQNARLLFETHQPEIVLMDIGLGEESGLELAKEMRLKNRSFVLLFLSALNDPETKVQGLEMGALDYITKPFALKELMLRLNRILQQGQEIKKLSGAKIHGKLKIWFESYELEDSSGLKISLTQKECAILAYLYINHNKVVSRDEIIDQVWGKDAFPSHRTVDNYIVKFRKWYETDPQSPIEIINVRGLGYKLIINK